jgi:hypothetical protein
MSQSITIRLTPERARLLNRLKRRFKVKKHSEAIDLVLRMNTAGEDGYRARVEKVSGCISATGKKNAVQRIRSLRDMG